MNAPVTLFDRASLDRVTPTFAALRDAGRFTRDRNGYAILRPGWPPLGEHAALVANLMREHGAILALEKGAAYGDKALKRRAAEVFDFQSATYEDGNRALAQKIGARSGHKCFGLYTLARGGVHSCRAPREWLAHGDEYMSPRGEIFDHVRYFRKDRRAYAIISHPYGNHPPLVTYGDGSVESWRLAGASWYYPGQTHAYLTARSVDYSALRALVEFA